MADRKSAGIPFLAIGIVFLMIGVTGQRAFLTIGIVFIVVGIVILVGRRQAGA